MMKIEDKCNGWQGCSYNEPHDHGFACSRSCQCRIKVDLRKKVKIDEIRGPVIKVVEF